MKHPELITSSLLTAFVIIGFVGCATSPEQVEAETKSAARDSLPDEVDGGWASVAAEVGQVPIGWLKEFKDSKLNKLVEEAQLNNRSLQGAAANLERSRALAEQAGAALAPKVNVSSGAGTGGLVEGASTSDYSLGVQMSWEVDLWGRIRSGRDAAANEFYAAELDYKYAQEALSAGVAQAYFVLTEAVLQEGVAARSVEMLTETNRIVKVQFDNGLANQQDVSLAKADLATAKERKVAAEGAKKDAARALELLLGRYPAGAIKAALDLPATPKTPPAGLPAELLERRPDLQAAERRIAASFNMVDQAEAARLPSISLTGSLGGASTDLGSVLNPANLAWQAASSLIAPLFDGGLRQSQVDQANAEQKAAIAAYAQSALVAFGEVEKALDDGVFLAGRRNLLDEANKSSEKAYRVAKINYEEGETDLLALLTVESRVNNSKSSLLTITRNQLSAYIDLNLALGGSWK